MVSNKITTYSCTTGAIHTDSLQTKRTSRNARSQATKAYKSYWDYTLDVPKTARLNVLKLTTNVKKDYGDLKTICLPIGMYELSSTTTCKLKCAPPHPAIDFNDRIKWRGYLTIGNVSLVCILHVDVCRFGFIR